MKKIIALLLVGILAIGSISVPAQAKTTSKRVNVSAMKKNRGTCIVSGKDVYYVKNTYKNETETTTLYKCNLKGENSVKIRTLSGYYTLGAVYNNKIYISKGDGTGGYNTYSIGKLGKGKLVLVKKDLIIYVGKGKYMIGAYYDPTDVSPSKLCLYNAKTNKRQDIGKGYCPVIVGKRVYYAVWDKKQKRFVVAYNVLGSKTKHVVAKFPKTYSVYVESLTTKQAIYYIEDNGNVTKYKLKY